MTPADRGEILRAAAEILGEEVQINNRLDGQAFGLFTKDGYLSVRLQSPGRYRPFRTWSLKKAKGRFRKGAGWQQDAARTVAEAVQAARRKP